MSGYDREGRGGIQRRGSSGSTTVKVSGFKELDVALGDLATSVGRAVVRRALLKAGARVANEAKRLAPVRTGKLRDSIAVSTKARNTAGVKAYADAMQAGSSRKEAGAALRNAQRASKGSVVEIHIGPAGIKYAGFMEFGTATISAQPYMRPAFESTKGAMVDDIASNLKIEIEKAKVRAAKRAAKV